MRTTVNIDDDLLRLARELAARNRRSLGDVVDDALRVLLAARPVLSSGRITVPVFGGGGLQPGVDLEDKDALAVLLGDDEPTGAAR